MYITLALLLIPVLISLFNKDIGLDLLVRGTIYTSATLIISVAIEVGKIWLLLCGLYLLLTQIFTILINYGRLENKKQDVVSIDCINYVLGDYYSPEIVDYLITEMKQQEED